MSINTDESGTITLAFMEPTIHELDNPADVFSDARSWAINVGILHNSRLLDVFDTRDTYDLDIDFHNGPQPLDAALQDLGSTLDTGRYIVIGADDDISDTVEDNNWEYIPLEDAADAAEWDLAT